MLGTLLSWGQNANPTLIAIQAHAVMVFAASVVSWKNARFWLWQLRGRFWKLWGIGFVCPCPIFRLLSFSKLNQWGYSSVTRCAPSPDATPSPDAAPAPDATPSPDVAPSPDATPSPDAAPSPDATPSPDAAPSPASGSPAVAEKTDS